MMSDKPESETESPRATMLTAPGSGGITVISLTGDGVDEILASIFDPFKCDNRDNRDNRPSPRKIIPGSLQLGRLISDDIIIDEVIVGKSEGAIELNIHGGSVSAAATMNLLAKCGVNITKSSARACSMLGEAGNSHPKFSNPAIGIELRQVLPSCESELLIKAISSQWSGGISKLATEILLDVPDEIPSKLAPGRLLSAAAGLTLMQKMLTKPEIVLIGPPNVGKSTLANALTARQVSIVHSTAGTTRDWVRERAVFFGFLGFLGIAVWITDTAGIWQTSDLIDAQSVARARQRAARADLVLLLGCDLGGTPIPIPAWLEGMNVIRVETKCDTQTENDTHRPASLADIAISAKTLAGLDQLRDLSLKALSMDDIDPTIPRAFTQRQADLLTSAANALDQNDISKAKAYLENLLTAL